MEYRTPETRGLCVLSNVGQGVFSIIWACNPQINDMDNLAYAIRDFLERQPSCITAFAYEAKRDERGWFLDIVFVTELRA